MKEEEEKSLQGLGAIEVFFLNAQFAKSFAIGYTWKSIVMQPYLRNNILSDWSNLVRGKGVVKRPASLYSYPIGLEVKSNHLFGPFTSSK